MIFLPVTGPPASPESFYQKNPLAKGGSLLLNDTTYDSLLGDGWSTPEEWGRWAEGQSAAVRVAVESGHDYRILIEAFPFCPPAFKGQTMEIEWNGKPLGWHEFANCENETLAFDLPAAEISGGWNDLRFEFGLALSPAQAGMSDDQRALSVGFSSISLVQQPR